MQDIANHYRIAIVVTPKEGKWGYSVETETNDRIERIKTVERENGLNMHVTSVDVREGEYDVITTISYQLHTRQGLG